MALRAKKGSTKGGSALRGGSNRASSNAKTDTSSLRAKARTASSPTRSRTKPAASSRLVLKEAPERATPKGRTPKKNASNVAARAWDVALVLEWLKGHSSVATLEGMARYAIPSDKALGVAMKDMKALGKLIGRNHPLALALWKTGIYEARMVAGFVADPRELTAEQMETWCRDFDNWAYCDTLCFSLFDRSPHAWPKVREWSKREKEFEKRTAFALLWSLALHDKHAKDAPFLEGLKLVEQAATDDRNFVKKAVSMALKAVGKRNPSLRAEAKTLASRLLASSHATARWIGNDCLKHL